MLAELKTLAAFFCSDSGSRKISLKAFISSLVTCPSTLVNFAPSEIMAMVKETLRLGRLFPPGNLPLIRDLISLFPRTNFFTFCQLGNHFTHPLNPEGEKDTTLLDNRLIGVDNFSVEISNTVQYHDKLFCNGLKVRMLVFFYFFFCIDLH